jgi:hypothetical protein
MFKIYLKNSLLSADESDLKKFAGEEIIRIEQENNMAQRILSK